MTNKSAILKYAAMNPKYSGLYSIKKATLPHHYGNEALLCNAALTGQFKPLERDKLDKAGLSLLTRLEARNAVLIGSGMGYRERKAALFDMAASYRHGMAAIWPEHAA